jgi:hypothetical protein
MAIAVDATSFTTNVANQTAGGTTTVSHVVGSGSNMLLIVSISTWNNGGTGAGCSSVTYGGTAMTLVRAGVANGAFYTEQWALVAPTSGTANIVATVAGKTDKLGMGNVSFSGADQTTGIDVSTNAIGTVGTVTASLTTTAAGEYLVDAASHLSANNPSSHTGTQIYSDAASGTSTVSQYGTATTAGTNSMSWSYPDPGDGWSYSVLAVKPSGGAAPVTSTYPTLMMMGV